MKFTPRIFATAWLAALVFLPLSVVRATTTVYVAADNSTGVNFFGTLDLATGQFTEIAETTPLFYGLTTGPDGVFYGADDTSNKLFTITTDGVTAPFGSVAAPDSFQGLAYSEATGGLYAMNLGKTVVSLYSITGDGSSESSVQRLDQPGGGEFATGSLAYGPNQKLYFNYSFDTIYASNSRLYLIDAATGSQTAVGSGLGTPILALFSDGTTLYGVDTFINKKIGIYTIDTTSGVATRVATVTGLPSDNTYYIDAATAVVTATPPTVPTVTVSTPDKTLVEGGSKGKIVFERSGGDTTTDLTVNYKLSGTAINGTDYGTGGGQPLATSITIPASATKAKRKVFAFADGETEGIEKLALKLTASSTGAYTIGSPAKVKISITQAQ